MALVTPIFLLIRRFDCMISELVRQSPIAATTRFSHSIANSGQSRKISCCGVLVRAFETCSFMQSPWSWAVLISEIHSVGHDPTRSFYFWWCSLMRPWCGLMHSAIMNTNAKPTPMPTGVNVMILGCWASFSPSRRLHGWMITWLNAASRLAGRPRGLQFCTLLRHRETVSLISGGIFTNESKNQCGAENMAASRLRVVAQSFARDSDHWLWRTYCWASHRAFQIAHQEPYTSFVWALCASTRRRCLQSCRWGLSNESQQLCLTKSYQLVRMNLHIYICIWAMMVHYLLPLRTKSDRRYWPLRAYTCI